MRTQLWITASLLIHFCLGLALVWTQSFQAENSREEVLDLTVLPYSTTKVSTPQQPSAKRINPARQKMKIKPSVGMGTQKVALEQPANESLADESQSLESSREGSENPTAWSELSTYPKILTEIKASYPEQAKLARVEGIVVLDVTVSTTGNVSDVQLVQGPGHGLDESAIEALKNFKFSPARKDAKPVAVKIRYQYKFKLGVN